jgi:hypothetical protein
MQSFRIVTSMPRTPGAIFYHELGARMIPFEFKNYDKQEIGTGEVTQTRDYLSVPMGFSKGLLVMRC